MNKEITGKVIAVNKQWWFKVNKKAVRGFGTDGAVYPYVIKASYIVDGKEYKKMKWIGAGLTVPSIGSPVRISYDESNPSKAKILL